MERLVVLAVVLALGLLLAGCGGGSSSGGSAGSGGNGGTLNVFAASSLTNAFPKIADIYRSQHPGWDVRFEFLGSDDLAAQIEQGSPADVFAAASSKYPEELQSQNLMGTTTNFATNTLVLVVPKDNPAGIKGVADLASTNAELVVGDPAVPLGSYTETVLGNLGIDPGSLNVVSQEQKATDVITKVDLGEADAGFVYVTDALAAGDKVKQIPLPAAAQATATYPIGIVSDSSQKEAAQQWIDLVMSPQGQKVLTDLGFGPAPSS
jgi:molybdate transport system substrate-binding protein